MSGGWLQNVFGLLKLLAVPPILSGPKGKMRWMWQLAWHVGMLWGGVRHGIEPPFHDLGRSEDAPQ